MPGFSGIFGIKKRLGFGNASGGAAPSSLLTGLTCSYSLNGNALKNVGTNDGTAVNVTYSAGKFNLAGDFGGTGQISIPDSSDFTFGNNDFAYSIWVKRSLFASRQIFSGQSNAAGSDISISFILEFQSNDLIRFLSVISVGVYGTVTSVTPIVDSNWHNLIIQRVGNNLELYIDGVLNAATTPFSPSDSINNSAFPFGIGNAGVLSILQFVGQIDEVNLWNGRHLTAQEITDLQTMAYPF